MDGTYLPMNNVLVHIAQPVQDFPVYCVTSEFFPIRRPFQTLEQPAMMDFPGSDQEIKIVPAIIFCLHILLLYIRSNVFIQFVSQVFPPSTENACSQCAELAVIFDQIKRQKMCLPSKTSCE